MIFAAAAACVIHDLADTRPVLSGPEQTSGDTRFLIHYTDQGADAILDDHTAAWALEGLERMWAAFVDQDGWPAPNPDEGIGGDDRLDVYVHVIDGNGYSHTQTLPSGAQGCYLEVDPSIAGVSQQSFESVAGHELHHCLQFRITTALAPWIYEATSTYAQYLLYTDEALDLAHEALWQLRLSGAAARLDSTVGSAEYAAYPFAKMIVDRAGARTALLARWQEMAAAGTWEVPSIADDATQLGLWQWFSCDRDDGRWASDNAACRLGTHVPPYGGDPIGLYGSAYVPIEPDCTSADLHVDVQATGAVRLQLVSEQPWTDSPIVTADAPATLDLAGWNAGSRAVLIATALDDNASFTYTVTTSGRYAPPPLPPLAAITVSPTSLVLAPGDRWPVRAESVYHTCADGSPFDVAWVSSDDTVARVDGGEIVAVGPGDATITATSGGVESKPIAVSVISQEGCCDQGGGGGSILLAGLLIARMARSRCTARRTRSASSAR